MWNGHRLAVFCKAVNLIIWGQMIKLPRELSWKRNGFPAGRVRPAAALLPSAVLRGTHPKQLLVLPRVQMELYFPVLTLRVQGGRLLAPGDPQIPRYRGAPRPAPPGQIPGSARRSAAEECGRAAGTRRGRRGTRAGRGTTAACRRGCGSRSHRPQKTTKAQAVFFGPSPAPRPTQRDSLGLEREPLPHPPVLSWIQPCLPVRFPVHLSRQEVPAAATVAPQPSRRRRRSSSRAGQPGFWCLAAVSGTRPRARHPSGRSCPSSLPASRPPPDPAPGGRGLRHLSGWARRVGKESWQRPGLGLEVERPGSARTGEAGLGRRPVGRGGWVPSSG